MYSIYILRTDDNKLYIGQTHNINDRIKLHAAGHGALFIKNKRFVLVYREDFDTREQAMRREKQLKGWTRVKKEALIKNDYKKLKEL